MLTEHVREFRYSEAKITKRLGLSRGEMKVLRDNELREGEDWHRRKENGEIALTSFAVKRIVAATKNMPQTIAVGDCLITAPAARKNGAATPLRLLPAPPMKLRVVRKVLNPRVLDAATPSGEIVHVIIQDASRYAYGAEFLALPSKQHFGFWEVVQPPQRARW